MRLHLLKSKIHQARVTQADLYYEGSITIDEDLLDAAHLLPFEKVQVVNINNGARFETYIIRGERGSCIVQLNGACARLAALGDQVIVMAYADMDEQEALNHQPIVVLVNEHNHISRIVR